MWQLCNVISDEVEQVSDEDDADYDDYDDKNIIMIYIWLWHYRLYIVYNVQKHECDIEIICTWHSV